MNKETEKFILLNFLKTGFSTRNLDILLGLSSTKTNGWKSWEILKKYFLQKEDKGKLYLYSTSQCNKVIDVIINNPQKGLVYKFINKEKPEIFHMYFNKYVLAKTPKDFYDMFTGETRNITQGFFLPNKKLIGICQFKGCYETKLETAHFKKNRPAIFKESAKKNTIGSLNNHYNKFDVYRTIEDYLLAHKTQNSICFLCKTHHIELDRLKDPKNKKHKRRYKTALSVYTKLIETSYSVLYQKKNLGLPKTNIPSFPLGLNLKRINKQSLTISWKKTPFSKEYILYRNGKEIYRGDKLTHTDKDIDVSQNYEYQLVASNTHGKSAISTLSLIKSK
ncbi:fibronectin type III domain-containing protein [Bacillus cereus]|uniref:fibronectin type III domain-containing protein n=1 Tax=Bacillus cereus TaxID=1396 RepID=UPI000BF4FBA2|nr:fibronectin type III domain-containing protein [Bacillus cereus]PFO84727.1 hypothetical protein COJ77_04025 [Bacillus cereus]